LSIAIAKPPLSLFTGQHEEPSTDSGFRKAGANIFVRRLAPLSL
jgi:hypothetical protein